MGRLSSCFLSPCSSVAVVSSTAKSIAVYYRLVEMMTGPVQIGHPAPEFSCTAVVDGRLKEVNLTSYTEANHWLILIFFPKAWSFICPTEIKAFSSRLEDFLYSRSCAVAFASTDSEYCLKAWNNTSDMDGGLGGAHVPLISDCNHALSKAYGVLIEEEGVAQRALFIIDPKGVVRAITVNDADIGRSVDETLRVLDALRFKDEFGEGCPVDWKKGDAGIDLKRRTTVDGALEVGQTFGHKKTWSEWARPKLNRAFSGTSQRSVASFTSVPAPTSRQRSSSNLTLNNGGNGSPSGLSSGQRSPLVSPLGTSVMNNGGNMQAQLDEAILMQQRMENMQAAMHNGAQSQQPGVGVAN